MAGPHLHKELHHERSVSCDAKFIVGRTRGLAELLRGTARGLFFKRLPEREALHCLVQDDLSVIVGAPEEFDLRFLLKSATAIRIAMAFGHESGWKEIEMHLRNSTAATVQILLGQAFFRTEPALLLKIRGLQETSRRPKFEVKLASVRATFHPKVWIIDSESWPAGIVGSGNLSGGGLLRNVECGLFTSSPTEVRSLREWFDSQWKSAAPLARTFDDYLATYQRIGAARKTVDAQIEAATKDHTGKEAKWLRTIAINMAREYWRSEVGMAEVQAREGAIDQRQKLLHHPSWQFGVEEWREFLRIPELGRIRLVHEQLTIDGLPQLKNILKSFSTNSMTMAKQVDDLQTVPGIGRNLATKLLAVYNPEKFVVVNGPVESALWAFDCDIEMSARIEGKSYTTLLKKLEPYIEECNTLKLRTAPALDAFFYAYQNFGTDGASL